MKIKYKLNFVHKLLCVFFLLLGIFSFQHLEAYQKEFIYGEQGKGFSFLQKGDYVLDIYYEASPKDNEIIVYTENLTNEKNQPEVEFLRLDAGKEGGKISTTLKLDRDTYGVNLKTASDRQGKDYISRVAIQSVQLQNRDNYLLGLIFILGALLILLLGMYVPLEKYAEPAMLIVLGLAASMPLFSDFIVLSEDLGFHVARMEAVFQGMRAGEFPVYLGSTQMGGFGMLSATMYPQLFLYPFAILRFFGVSLMLCYKLLVVCMHIGSAFTSYFSAKKLCKSAKIGFWASVFYTFSIYRLTNTYFRAAIGETLAMVFLPLVIWGMYEVLWGNHKKWYLLALGVGGVLQSHVSSVAMCVFFLLIELVVWLISSKRTDFGKRILAGIKATVMTILVNASFLVPFLFFSGEPLQCFDMPNQLSETVVYFSQMFSLFAQAQGKDMDTGSTVGEMPHTIGVVLLLGAVLLCVMSLKEKEKREDMQVGKRCLVYGLMAVLMASWLFPWEKVQNIPLLHAVITSLQFAWRFFGPASALLSIAAAVGVVRFGERVSTVGDADGEKHVSDRRWVYGLVAVLTVCSTSYFFGMKGFVSEQISDKMEFNGYGYTDSMYMYSDGESFKAHHLEYSRRDSYIIAPYSTEVEYSNYQREGMKLQVTVNNLQNGEDYLVFPFYYYPGYEILVDGEPVEVLSFISRVACELPEGTADIEVYYRGQSSFTVANWVSLLTVMGIVIYNILLLVNKKKPDSFKTKAHI